MQALELEESIAVSTATRALRASEHSRVTIENTEAMLSAEAPSSPMPSGGSAEEDLAYYKAQYEQLELELQEFQTSSKELEAELEKDVEASEKRERQLQEKVEGLGYQVDEWKVGRAFPYMS